MLINSVLDSISYVLFIKKKKKETKHPYIFDVPYSNPQRSSEATGQSRRTFLWERGSNGHEFHLAKWSKVILPKKLGGRGIRDLCTHNKCLLMKWLWRFNQEDNPLQKEVVRVKHVSRNHWCNLLTRSPYGVWPWMSIRKLRSEFFTESYFKLSNGISIKFWKATWLEGYLLADSPKSELHYLLLLARQQLVHSIQEGLAGLGVSRSSNLSNYKVSL